MCPPPKSSPENPKSPRPELDQQTLYTSASIVAQVGFSHFELSQDTRVPVEARKAHRFVSINCEEIARQILRLSGATEEEVTEQTHAIAGLVVEHRKKMKAAKSTGKPE